MGLLGMLVEVEQVWIRFWGFSSDEHQLCCSPRETQQENFWALDIWASSPVVILGNTNWNVQEEARATISWGLFTFQRWWWFPCKKPSQGLVWAGRSLEEALGHSAGDRLSTKTLPEACWVSSQLYSKPPTRVMAQPAWTAYSNT